MSSENNIPKHWQVKKLGEVGEIVSGGTPSTKVVEYWNGKISWITPADLSGYNEKTIYCGRKSISETGLKNSSARLIPKGSILFSSRAPIGYVVIAGKDVCTNQGFKSIVPNQSVISDFVYYFLKAAKKNAEDVASGTTFKEISLRNFSNLDIPIPPLPEQLAIVSKIEELFSELDKGVESLKTAQQQLKVYRQSLLKWAFEGRLTSTTLSNRHSPRLLSVAETSDKKEAETSGNIAAERKEKYNNGELPGTSALSLPKGAVQCLPKGWKWVKLGDVCNKIGDIDHKMPKQLTSGYPYVSTKDFTDNLKISFDNAKYISKEDFINLSRKIKPEKGDIIFPRYGTIGKNILVDFDKDFLVSYSCAVIKPNEKIVSSKYVYLYSLSPIVTEEIRKYVVETTQANVGIASIKNFVFPLPPLQEQQLIVNELESRLTVCDKIEETINNGLQQSEALRQSILKKAFEGRLI